MQEKRDREITREDYIEVVKHIERDFLAGVQTNLRSRLFAGWIANLRSIMVPDCTRTKYLGELLEKHIYSRVKDGGGGRFLNELQIAPKDGGWSSIRNSITGGARPGSHFAAERNYVEHRPRVAVRGELDGRAADQHQ